MMKLLLGKTGLALALMGWLGQPARAQAPVPPKAVVYYAADGQRLPSAEGADHREERVYRDSVGGTLRVYYPSGKLRRTTSYAHFERDIRSGVDASFYETGQIKGRREYHLDKVVGEALTYYPTGVVRSRKNYDERQEGERDYFTPDGQPRPAPSPDDWKMPVPARGSLRYISAQVQRRLRYPAEARRQKIKGRMLVEFVVDEAGFIRHIHVVKSISPVLDAAVIEAVASLGRFVPARQDGEPVEVAMTMPLTF